jgi:GTP-binding protein
MEKVVIIGRPNAGKSSFFNRLVKDNDAITSSISGTTRDVKLKECSIEDKTFMLVDTGGLDDSNEMFAAVKKKSLDFAKEASVILYMVDGKQIPEDEDKAFFFDLQKLNVPIALVVNKVDNDKEEERGWNFTSFGAKDLFLVSTSHNRKVSNLTSWIYHKLPKQKQELLVEDVGEFSLEQLVENMENEVETNEINVAIIGRPNVGKSSILNALVGEDVSVVSSIAGTTIDPVDESFSYKDKTINFVDTAGLRRRGRIKDLEKYALLRTTKRLELSNIALLVLDVEEGFKELDEKIASLVDKHFLGCIVVFNKWDENQETYEKTIEKFKHRFKFLFYAPYIAVSAKTGRNVEKLKELILKVYESYAYRISTSKLNELVQFATTKHHLPSYKGTRLKIYYATQYHTKPMKIALVMNKPQGLHFSYQRYLSNTIREQLNLTGSPIIINARGKNDTRLKDDS